MSKQENRTTKMLRRDFGNLPVDFREFYNKTKVLGTPEQIQEFRFYFNQQVGENEVRKFTWEYVDVDEVIIKYEKFR